MYLSKPVKGPIKAWFLIGARFKLKANVSKGFLQSNWSLWCALRQSAQVWAPSLLQCGILCFHETAFVFGEKNTPAGYELSSKNDLLSSWDSFLLKIEHGFKKKTEEIFLGWTIMVECSFPQGSPAWSVNYGRSNTWSSPERTCVRSYSPGTLGLRVLLTSTTLTLPSTTRYWLTSCTLGTCTFWAKEKKILIAFMGVVINWGNLAALNKAYFHCSYIFVQLKANAQRILHRSSIEYNFLMLAKSTVAHLISVQQKEEQLK